MQFKELEPIKKGDGGGPVFIKLKDKESVIGAFRGNPYEFESHWLGNKSYPCNGESCEYCKQGNKKKFRFRINFITKDPTTGKLVAKIMEQGRVVYEEMSYMHKKYNLEKKNIEITRRGEGTETTYRVEIYSESPNISPQLEALYAAIPLHDLAPKEADTQSSDEEGHYSFPAEEMSEIPF